ncbi:MAG: hypothetical protein R2684_06140 [Pyrinomonadaceae bacterium]
MTNRLAKFVPVVILLSILLPASIVAQRSVLATSGGKQLKEDHVQVYVNLLQFIIGQKIKAAEATQIRNESIREFNEDPKKYLDEVGQWEGVLNRLRQTTDPVQIADGRMMFVREFYKFTQNTPANDLPATIKIFNRYVQVLHYDTKTQLVLTNKDIDAVLSYIDFSRQMAGMTRLGAVEKKNFKTYLPQYYAQLPAQYQAAFALMPIVWEVIDGQWKRLTPAQRKQATAQFQAQNVQQQVPQYQQQTPTGAYQNQQQMQQQAQMYQTLSNMSRSSHMTTMNILENIGDGGGYWKMSDNL